MLKVVTSVIGREEARLRRRQRLAGERARVTLRREQEDLAERKQRLAGDRARVALRREQEDPAEREQRLAVLRVSAALRSEEEDPAERKERLDGNRAWAAQRRRLEEEEDLSINTRMLNFHELTLIIIYHSILWLDHMYNDFHCSKEIYVFRIYNTQM